MNDIQRNEILSSSKVRENLIANMMKEAKEYGLIDEIIIPGKK